MHTSGDRCVGGRVCVEEGATSVKYQLQFSSSFLIVILSQATSATSENVDKLVS